MRRPSRPAGRSINKNCRHCHGLRGRGDGPLAPKDPKPSDLTDAKWDHGASDGEIFAVIWNGAPSAQAKGKDEGMKGMKGTLTEKNVWEVVNYLRSIGPAPAAAREGGHEISGCGALSSSARSSWPAASAAGCSTPAPQPATSRAPALPGQSTGVFTTARSSFGEALERLRRPASERNRSSLWSSPTTFTPARRSGARSIATRPSTIGSGGRAPERSHVHDLPQRYRHGSAAHQTDHGDEGPWRGFRVASCVRLHAAGAREVQPRAAHPREGRMQRRAMVRSVKEPSRSGTST